MFTPGSVSAIPASRTAFGFRWLRRRYAGTPDQRRELLTEVADMAEWLAEQELAVRPSDAWHLDRRAQHRRLRRLGDLVAQLLEAHPADQDGHCTRCVQHGGAAECPAGETIHAWQASWDGTGGLAERREGDPTAVSTRRLL